MRTVSIPVGQQTIEGGLILPENAKAAVIFAHGSSSSRHSPRNKYVAGMLNFAGLATLLIDLLAPEEDLWISERPNIASILICSLIG